MINLKQKLSSSQLSFFIVISAVLIYTVLLSTICVLKYNAFSYYDFDFALHIQKYWNILHGNTYMGLIRSTIWGNALEVIAFPFSALYFLLFLSPAALLVLQSLILGVGAIPVFLIARRTLPEKLAVCFAISYLFYPALWFLNLYEYHDMVLVTPAFLFAFYFFKEGRFRPFFVCLILAIMCRVDVALVVFMFCVYGFLEKKSPRWLLSPLVLSALWVTIGLFVIIPMFRHDMRYDIFYAHLGKDFPEIVKNMIFKPQIVLKALFSRQNGVYAFQMLFPVLFLPFLALKELLFCVFTLLQHLVSLRASEHTINFHYTAPIVPFVYASAITALSRFLDIRNGNKKNFVLIGALVVILPIVANFYYGPLSNAKNLAASLIKDNADAQKEILLRQIPKDSSVISTFEFTPRLANRRLLYSFHYVVAGDSALMPLRSYQRIPDAIDYALLDFEDSLTLEFYNTQSDARIKQFLEQGEWGLVDSIGNIALLKKKYSGGLKLYEIRSGGMAQDERAFIFQYSGVMRLINFEAKTTKKYSAVYLETASYWKCLKKTDQDLGFIVMILDEDNHVVFAQAHPFCYGIYPTQRWQEGDVMVDYFNMALPSFVRNGRYSIGVLFYSKRTGRMVFEGKTNKLITLAM